MNNSERILSSQCSFNGIDDDINNCARDKWKNDMASLCGKVFSIFDIARNYRNIVDPQKIYVAKFPPELIKKMQTHDIQFLRDKVTDDILPTLYDYTEGGFGGQIRLELKGGITNQDITNLCNSFSNVIEQKKYDNISEQLQQIYTTVKTIERGQQNDRIAEIKAGKNQLIAALSIENDEEIKKNMIANAISSLYNGKEKIERSICDKLDSISKVPSSAVLQFIYSLFINRYFEKRTDEYEEIQELFKYYCISLSALSYGYTCLNQSQLIDSLINECSDVFEHKNLPCLKPFESLVISYEHSELDFNKVWYNCPTKYKNNLLLSTQRLDSNEFLIEIPGVEVMEVLSNEKRT